MKLKIPKYVSLVLLFFASQANAMCFEEAGSMYGIPPTLLKTIASQESSMNPTAINYNKNGTYDFGLMGINSSWAGKIGLENWLKLDDSCVNAKMGAWILAMCIADHGYSWKAVGCYNAVSEPKRIKYAWKIHDALKKHAEKNNLPAKKAAFAEDAHGMQCTEKSCQLHSRTTADAK